MKVILSGATGYIGSSALHHCLTHPRITTIVLLLRRPLPDSHPSQSHPSASKINPIVVPDFTSYSDQVQSEIVSADAAIWCLGTKTGDERVNIEFPLAFIAALKAARKEGGMRKEFRFVQVGGALSQWPPTSPSTEREALWVLPHARRIKGEAEARVFASADEGGGFHVWVARPGVVVEDTGVVAWLVRSVLGEKLSVGIGELGSTLVDLAVDGDGKGKKGRVVSNKEVIERGIVVLKQMK